MYQDIRGFYQQLTSLALVAGGVTRISFDNFGETAGGADESYALVSLTFGGNAVDVIGCEGMEVIRGTLQVNLYTPKQEGTKPAEDICNGILKAWQSINKLDFVLTPPLLSARTLNLEGPLALNPDKRPHHATVVSCSILARVA